MTDQLKAVLNRCIFSSALKLVRDEADCTAIKSKPFGSDAFADLFTDSIGVHDNDLLNPRIAWATRMPVPVHIGTAAGTHCNCELQGVVGWGSSIQSYSVT